jgi:ketosteroid isomerase-like protein
MPLVGRDAAATWAASAWTTVRYTAARTEAAGSGDLGVTLGGYDATTTRGPEHGTWVRVWKRDVTGRWRVVFETSKKTT